MSLVDNIGTNAFVADVLRIKLLQSDVIIIERIAGVQETIFKLIFPIIPRRIIIPSNTMHEIINGNAVHTNRPYYYRTEVCSEYIIIVSRQLWYRGIS